MTCMSLGESVLLKMGEAFVLVQWVSLALGVHRLLVILGVDNCSVARSEARRTNANSRKMRPLAGLLCVLLFNTPIFDTRFI